jgi:hypothetical protein
MNGARGSVRLDIGFAKGRNLILGGERSARDRLNRIAFAALRH